MITSEKSALLEQMKKQRFLPITEETFRLYESYAAAIDSRDPDEISQLLYYKGEHFYRIGNLKKSLDYLARCLQAPKSRELRYLDALAYNIIGLIYSFLGQESIAINNLLECQAISSSLHLDRESAVCCVNLGLIYSQLSDYPTALTYYDHALTYASTVKSDYYNMKILCQAYRGITFCKMGQYEKALAIYHTIEELKKENGKLFYDASVLNLNIRLYDYLKDETMLHENLDKLLTLVSSNYDFLELSEFYFDICDYLLKKQMPEETNTLLQYMDTYIESSPLEFLRYNYLKYAVTYAHNYASEKDYLNVCSRFIALRPAYQEEQRYAKLYSLDYIERVRQAKNDSEKYRIKSRIDQMTGLLNKYTIQFLVMENLANRESGKQSAMILIDLDHFKQLNDTLGHLAGDDFICQTASVIQDYFKENALCGRVGGDEFLIFISHISDVSFVVLQTEILRQEICRKTSEHNILITTQASIGIAFSSEYCCDYEGLFAAADSALYRAKTSGRNKVVVAE